MTKKDSSSLTARQKARQAIARESEQLKRRQSALEAGFSALDELDAAKVTLGRALAGLVELGDTNTTAGDALGLTAREVGAYIKAAKAADEDTAGTEDRGVESSASSGATAEQSVSAAG